MEVIGNLIQIVHFVLVVIVVFMYGYLDNRRAANIFAACWLVVVYGGAYMFWNGMCPVTVAANYFLQKAGHAGTLDLVTWFGNIIGSHVLAFILLSASLLCVYLIACKMREKRIAKTV